MKKLILLSLALFCFSFVNAQKGVTLIHEEGDSAWYKNDSTICKPNDKNDKKVCGNGHKKQHPKKNATKGNKNIWDGNDYPTLESTLTCSAPINLVAQAVVSPYGGCGLYVGWQNNGSACWLAVNVNGSDYPDATTGYTIWTSGVNGLVLGVDPSAGKVFNIYIRDYVSCDTTGSIKCQSVTITYTVPSDFLCNGTPPPALPQPPGCVGTCNPPKHWNSNCKCVKN